MTMQSEYRVLARAFRPQTFPQILGQEHVTRTLQNAIAHNRIPHAIILSGPRGTGKTSIARIMAKAINCLSGPTADPCNACSNCLEITGGISLDVREIDGASNRGIDEIRELRENVNFSPATCLYKVYIIDEVHMLTREAFNALLKTLEEPPSHTIFIFATTEIQKVPATIISRCQSFDLRRISLRQITASLSDIAGREGIIITERALGWLAEAADGSLRDAQGLLDQAISFTGGNITDDKIEELLGLEDRKLLFLLSEAIFLRNPAKCLETLEDAYSNGTDMRRLNGMFLRHLRNCLLIKILGAGASMLDISPEEISRITSQVAAVSREHLQRLLDMMLREEERINRSHEPRISCEVMLVRMALLSPAIPVLEIIDRLEMLEKRLTGLTIDAAEPFTAPPGSPEIPALVAHGDEHSLGSKIMEKITTNPWEQCKTLIKKNSPVLYSKIAPGRFLGLDQGILRLGFPCNYLFLDDLRSKETLLSLTEIAAGFFPELKKIEFESLEQKQRETSNGVSNGSVETNKSDALRRDALNHPALRRISELFENAEIREIIPRKHNPCGTTFPK